jgi:hypothetical protein
MALMIGLNYSQEFASKKFLSPTTRFSIKPCRSCVIERQPNRHIGFIVALFDLPLQQVQ